ncbi:hypothetical protein TNCV_710801 [Trichonephila clavipes]|nr:hypothetical protein TNCV_710801 [Trichonephila clavipes]
MIDHILKNLLRYGLGGDKEGISCPIQDSHDSLDASCHPAWHRLIKFSNGVLRNFVPNCLKYWAKSSAFRDGCDRFPVTSQMCSMGKRSGNLAGRGNERQA